jgi:uncharacterized membrane protein YphA (DoxX/SURF4 family)
MKLILTISRYLVGLLFIFSGLIKANDPLGLSYKMQEFFEVWGLHQFHEFTLSFSVLMIAFEIIAGVAVIIGWQMRLFSWLLLLLIIFFTFLTGYALFSGKIKTCGCFGDCIPLTADQSFLKDLVLLVLILLLFVNRKRIVTSMSSRNAMLALFITTVFSFGLQWYVLNYLPVLDCLPYKKGARIEEQMKIPAGAIPDSTVITFVYNKAGQEVEFTADQFPEDFDESVYSFVRRYDKLIRKGNAEPKIKDFVLLAPGGTDTTNAIINQSGDMYWLFIQSLNESDKPAILKQLIALKKETEKTGKPVYVITSLAGEVEPLLATVQTPVLLLRCDAVAVKTAARYPVTLYRLQDGVIREKKAVR